MGTRVLDYLNPWSPRIDFEGLHYPKVSVPDFNDVEERKRLHGPEDGPTVETKQDSRKSEMLV